MDNNNNNFLEEYRSFLTNEFATNEKEWIVYVDFIALNFLKLFYANLKFLNKKLKVIVDRKKKEISEKEKENIVTILKFSSLVNEIKIDYNLKKIDVNINKIKNQFSKINGPKEIKNNNNNIKELNLENNKEVLAENKNQFLKLNNCSNFLISYIKEESTRKYFYQSVFLKGEFDIFSNLKNKNIYSSINK